MRDQQEIRIRTRSELEDLRVAPAGFERLLRVGELTQGILDERFDRAGRDDWSKLERVCSRLLTRAASQDSLDEELDTLRSLEPPEFVRVRSTQGFASYALHADDYALNAKQLPRGSTWKVVAVRSIGTVLGARVAVELNAPLYTVRPIGPTHEQCLRVSDSMAHALLDSLSRYVVVDEGSGTTSASFDAVTDWLASRGVSEDRVYFLSSKTPDFKPERPARARLRWQQARNRGRVREASPRIPAFLQSCESLSRGLWRQHILAGAILPADPRRERLKFLEKTKKGGAVLWKYEGLGRQANLARELALLLDEHHMTPPIIEQAEGWQASRWVEGMDLRMAAAGAREDWIKYCGGYLALRSRCRSANPGASNTDLCQMIIATLRSSSLGDTPLDWVRARLNSLVHRLEPTQPVLVDARLHAWEWRFTPTGQILKCDAIDHHRDRDGAGPQPITWDLAGAEIEAELGGAELDHLLRSFSDAGAKIPSPASREFHRLAYLCLQLRNYNRMATEAGSELKLEAGLIAQELRRYQSHVRRWVSRCSVYSFAA